MKTAREIANAILTGNMNDQDLNTIIFAINAVRAEKRNAVRRQLRAGQRVKFWSNRYGCDVTGVIMKMMPKNVKVKADDGMIWTVSPGLLKDAVK